MSSEGTESNSAPPNELPDVPVGDRYWCFISYRHADNKADGRRWATWLHKELEAYQVPRKLVGTKSLRGDTIPKRIFPVFRDEEELPADARLSAPIEAAVRGSRFLVVLCSPNAVLSRYVADEIIQFKRLSARHPDRILAVILSGDPAGPEILDPQDNSVGFDRRQCFPRALRFSTDAEGNSTPENCEPIAADFRAADGREGWLRRVAGCPLSPFQYKEHQTERRKQFLKVVAGVLGVTLGTLTERDWEFRRQRTRLLACWALLVAIALGLAVWQTVKVRRIAREREQHAIDTSEALINSAIEVAANGRQGEAIARLARAAALRPRDATALTAGACRAFGPNSSPWKVRFVAPLGGDALRMIRMAEEFRPDEVYGSVKFSPDGRFIVLFNGDDAAIAETASGVVRQRLKLDWTMHEFVFTTQFSDDGGQAAIIQQKTKRSKRMEPRKDASREEGGLMRVQNSKAGSQDLGALREHLDRTTPVRIHAIDLVAGKFGEPVKLAMEIRLAILSPDFHRLATLDGKGKVRLCEYPSLRELGSAELGTTEVQLRFNSVGTVLEARALGAGTATPVRYFRAVDGTAADEAGFTSENSGLDPDIPYWLPAEAAGKYHKDIPAEVSATLSGQRVVRWSHSADWRWIVAICEDASVRMLERVPCLNRLQVRLDESPNCIAYSPTRNWLAINADKTARVLDLDNGGAEISRATFEKSVTGLDFSPDGASFVAATADGTIQFHAAGNGERQMSFKHEHLNWIDAIRVCRNKTAASRPAVIIAVAMKDIGLIARHDGVGGEKIWAYRNDGGLKKAMLDPGYDDKTIALLEKDEVDIYSIDDGKITNYVRTDPKELPGVTGGEIETFSCHAKQWAASITRGHYYWQVWSLYSRKLSSEVKLDTRISAQAISPDGQWVVLGCKDNSVRVFDLSKKREIARFGVDSDPASMRFSPDGSALAVGCWGKAVEVLELGWFAPPGEAASANWLRGLQFQAGQRVDEFEALRILRLDESGPGAKLTALKDAISSGTGLTPWEMHILEWAAALPDSRTTTPWTGELLIHAAGRKLMSLSPEDPDKAKMAKQLFGGDSASIRNLYGLDFEHSPAYWIENFPWHPLSPLAAARSEPDRSRRHWLVRETLQRLRRADLGAYGQETLTLYAAWAAKVLSAEMREKDEALQAVALGLERASGSGKATLLDLKARIESGSN